MFSTSTSTITIHRTNYIQHDSPSPNSRQYRHVRDRSVLTSGTALTHFDSSETNAQASPLLRLPAEVRALIFTHVLGTHEIRLKPQIRNFEIRASPDDTPLAREEQKSFLNLTLVSRQLYVETAMIPFVHSTWVLDHESEMCQKGLAQRLLPAQANAIATVKCRPETVFHHFDAGSIASRHCIRTFAHLEGLRCLVIALDGVHLRDDEKECMVGKVKELHGKEQMNVIVSNENLRARQPGGYSWGRLF